MWIFDIIRSWFTKPVPPTPIPPAPIPQPKDNIEISKNWLLDLHNKEREKKGLGIFVRNEKLDLAAQKHNDWMARNNALEHNEPGNSVSSRVSKEGYSWSTVGENIFWTELGMLKKVNKTIEVFAVEEWMNSSGHRANILNGRFKEVGFGITQDSLGNWWLTADFGAA